jgi:pyridoxal phosphate enzyme (YggS family)
VAARIGAAARGAGRDPAAVTLVAVTNTLDAATVRAAYESGQRDFGENRAAELAAKAAVLPDDCRWHMIGPVQTNKVRLLVAGVALWHTVDRVALITELARRVPGAAVLIEVNVGGEPQKAGCAREEVAALVARARSAGLEVRGLMCIPPADGDPRPHFAWLRGEAHRLELDELSMGMSGDFEVAVEEGATLVRVGTALFGPRGV